MVAEEQLTCGENLITRSDKKYKTGRRESLRSTAGEAVLEGVTDETGRIARAELNQAPTLSVHSNTIARPRGVRANRAPNAYFPTRCSQRGGKQKRWRHRRVRGMELPSQSGRKW